MKHIVIIGNGIAGITAARHIRKHSDHRITVISAESDHFFSRTALMYIYMGHMAYANTKPYEDDFWTKNRIHLLREYVRQVDSEKRLLHFGSGSSLAFDQLLIASGSQSNKFGWPGQDLPGVQGLYSLQDLELMEEFTRGIRRAVVVGGGLIGIEMTEMLLSRGIPVTFLVREKSWMDFAFPAEESAMITRHIGHHGVDLRLATELDRIVADEQGRARAVMTKDGEEIEAGFVGLTVGVSPNIGFLQGSGVETQKGVLVDELLQTNVPGIYAAGDCAQLREPKPGRRPIEALWYTGRQMGETVARTLCGKPTAYEPALWFNSAKFLDLEWQVYGNVAAEPGEGEESLFWEHPDGLKSLRIVYRRDDLVVLGFNVMGIRYRHDLCQRWLEQAKTLPYVLEHLGAANFDPELYAQHEKDLLEVYRRRHPDRPLQQRSRRGLASFLRLMQAS
jgi:NAD(P)H-nitrite reductase large subunit